LHRDAVGGSDLPNVFTPDAVMAGAKLSGPVVVFDDDHYYMGAVIAGALRRDGLSVALVTPTARVCAWAEYTTEQERSHARLLELDVDPLTENVVVNFDGEAVDLACVHTGRTSRRAAAPLVMVTARTPAQHTSSQTLR
jgi:dimethylamine/trimethylamine dehydrogenase